MIRTASSLLAAIIIGVAAAPALAEGPPHDVKAKQQERENKRVQMKTEMRQTEDRQRQEQRGLEDRHDSERKAMRDKHNQEREALRQKMVPK